MDDLSAREEQLLLMIGEQRASNSPKQVAAAERELARRAGETRRQAIGRIRASGMVIAFVGLLIVALAAGIYEVVAMLSEALGGVSGGWIVPGAIGLCGLAVVGLGIAVVLRNGWVLGVARLIPFLRSADVEVAAYKPDTAGLVRLIGSGRPVSAPEAVATAEGQMRERLLTGREHLRARVRSWGSAVVALGVLMLINSAGIGLILLLMQALQGMGQEMGTAGLVSGLDIATTWAMAVVNAVLGVVLLFGGVGLRAHMEWGRGAVLWGLWASLVATVLAGPVAALSASGGPGSSTYQLLSLVCSAVIDVAWLAICWWVARLLGRPEVKEACGAEAPLPGGLR